MKITKVKDEIKHTVEIYLQKDEHQQYMIPANRQRPIFLVGAPGIGKTAIVGQVAAEMRLGYISYSITHHTRQSAIGLPYISKHHYGQQEFSVTEYTLSEIIASVYDAIEKQGHQEGILFIDEINCVSETLAPAMLDLLQNKKFGPHKIPEGWILITAGNPVVFNKSAREFDTVTLDRIKKIVVDTDYEMWKPYAYQALIHNSVMYYLQLKPQYILLIEKTIDGDSFVTPRAWEDLSVIIKNYQSKNYPLELDSVLQYLQHPDVARDFYNFYLLFLRYQERYQIKDLFEGNQGHWRKELKEARFDERIAFVHMISDYFNTQVNGHSNQKSRLDMMKSLARSIENMSAEDIMVRLTRTVEINQKMLANNILSNREKSTRRWFLDQVTEIQHQLITGTMSFGSIHDLVQVQEKNYKKDGEVISDQIATALEFCVEIFGKSQELVLLLMNMVTSRDIVEYLSSHECPTFFRLNEEMLLDDRNKQLLQEIEAYKQAELTSTDRTKS